MKGTCGLSSQGSQSWFITKLFHNKRAVEIKIVQEPLIKKNKTEEAFSLKEAAKKGKEIDWKMDELIASTKKFQEPTGEGLSKSTNLQDESK